MIKGFRFKLNAPVVLLVLTLTLTSWADVYVKNRLFKGEVRGEGPSTTVEAEPMLKALGVSDYQFENDQLTVNGTALSVSGGLVSLKALTEAVGAKMVVNTGLGTIDVYTGVAKKDNSSAVGSVKGGSNSASSPRAGLWLTNMDEALREAKRTKKTVMLYTSGDGWCGVCADFQAKILDTPEFKTWASEKVIPLKMDFPPGYEDDPTLSARWQQYRRDYEATIPGITFLDEKGQKVGINYGHDQCTAAEWVQYAEANMRPLGKKERWKPLKLDSKPEPTKI